MSDSQLDQMSFEERLPRFVEAWTRHLAAAVNSLLGEQVELIEDAQPASNSPNCWFHLAFPPLAGTFSLGFDREAVLTLGAEFDIRAPAVQAEGPERALKSFGKMLGLPADRMAADLSTRCECEVRAAALTISDQPPPSANHALQLRLVKGDRSYPVSAVFDGTELLRSFGCDPPPRSACSTPTNALAASIAVDSLAVNTRNLHLLLDVELPVSVSFGRAQLPLKDVIKLTTGSIVELNRSVSEPVDIIVNNCTIARGEVVVVEGNFGVRIKQIVRRQERLRSVT